MAKNKFVGKIPQENFKNVLIARFSALGDVAMTIPVVYSVCRANPETRFIMITQIVSSTLFINMPSNLVVLGVDIKDKYHGLHGLYNLSKELRAKYSIDAFVDLHDVLRTHILSLFFFIARIPVKRINKGRVGKRSLTRRRNKRMFPLISSRARYREVFYRFGFKFTELFESVFGENKADASEFADISAPKKPNEKWIAIAPFAKHQGKVYPLTLMEKVLATLTKWDDTHVFLFGAGEQEQEILKSWVGKYPNVTSLAEKRNGFPKELALLSNIDVMVSMDSANMHLASLVKLPVVSVWGATHPYCGFMGWRQEEQNAVQLNMACRPCSVFGNKPCLTNDYFCLTGISPQMIISRIKKILDNE
ncbi:MAG: glycosyltransferase family 9 protein [Muribaculaceae bacterium]